MRIQGLIEQREGSLRKIADIAEKRNPRDLKANQKLIEDELVVFRTLSLYILEYIQTWTVSTRQRFSERNINTLASQDTKEEKSITVTERIICRK